jgi:phosphohistidine phosphatase
LRMVRLRSLSSAPPMIISGPGCSDVAMGSSGTGGMTGKASRCESAHVTEHSRQLVVMRHAKAEPGGASDFDRELAVRGYGDALEAGRWLAGAGFDPDGALVSAARRTAGTWQALAEGGSFDVQPTLSESLYAAGPETTLDLVRETPDDVRSLLVVGHNPTMAYLAQLLDDGTGDEDAGRQMATGFPTAALAWFEVSGSWVDLELASARLIGFHVGRGA